MVAFECGFKSRALSLNGPVVNKIFHAVLFNGELKILCWHCSQRVFVGRKDFFLCINRIVNT